MNPRQFYCLRGFIFKLMTLIKHWDIPTDIMYGSKDILQSIEIVRHFSMKFNCQLYIAKESEHSFMSDSDRKIVTDWIEGSI